MKVILAMVMSADGKTTKWDNPNIYKWTSQEDKEHFFTLIERNNLIIMGRKTYETAKSIIKLSPGRLRIVFTKTPGKFKNVSIPGQLEFTSDSSVDLIKKLEKRGYKQALLAGGGEVNASFFKAKLISEVWITVEPRIFASGNSLSAKDNLEISLYLESIERLNEKGTILLKYEVL